MIFFPHYMWAENNETVWCRFDPSLPDLTTTNFFFKKQSFQSKILMPLVKPILYFCKIQK